jgi:dynein light chain roadblock-type
LQSTTAESDEIITRISGHKGVVGVIVFSTNGLSIKSNLNENQTILWGALVGDVIERSKVVAKSMAEGGFGTFSTIRIQTKKYQITIALERDFYVFTLHKIEDENRAADDDDQQEG